MTTRAADLTTDRIRAAVRKAVSSFAQGPLPDDENESLFDSGVIDSFGLMDVIARLEETLEIKVPDSDLNPRRFETLKKIDRYFEARASA